MSSDPVVSHTLVIGEGPGDLAIGVCLKQARVGCIILEQNGNVAPAWHRRYDRLHLNTDKRNSQLPFTPS